MSASSEVVRSVRNFLDKSGCHKAGFCPTCGALMQHVNATFYFEGSTWDLPVPFCPNCTAAAPKKTALRAA